MAVATPILERKTEEREMTNDRQDNTAMMTEDEIHNFRIPNMYARLINPASKLSDFKTEPQTQTVPPVQAYAAPQEQQVAPNQVYLVQNARADADIFRADSAVNMRPVAVTEVDAAPQTNDEDNEDLVPSRTTMQYSAEAKADLDEGTIINKGAQKHISLSKRDKIVIGVVISVIIALFVLIIVNSVLISNVNDDLGTLQTSLNDSRSSYENVVNEVNEYESNFDATLQALAEQYGMVK